MDAERKKKLMIQASEIREKTVELIYHGGGGHIGGDLSETDVMVVLFDKMKHDPKNPKWEGRDYFILSKGHSAETYYSLLNRYGYIGQKEMDEFGSFGALLGGHPNKKVNGVEANTGSLGHGLGFATGIAIALKKNEKENHVYVITGDGELAEGSNWEALMSAAKYKLDNLTWIVDRNHLQISGNTEDVMPIENLKEKQSLLDSRQLRLTVMIMIRFRMPWIPEKMEYQYVSLQILLKEKVLHVQKIRRDGIIRHQVLSRWSS